MLLISLATTQKIFAGVPSCNFAARSANPNNFISLNLTHGRAANNGKANLATLNLNSNYINQNTTTYQRTNSGSAIQLLQTDFLTFGTAGSLLLNWQDGNTINQRSAIVDESYYSIFLGVADAVNLQVFDLESLKPVLNVVGVDTFVSTSSVPNGLLLPGITHVLKEAVNETTNPYPAGVYNNWKSFTGFKYRQFRIDNSNANNDVFQYGYALKPTSGSNVLVDETNQPS